MKNKLKIIIILLVILSLLLTVKVFASLATSSRNISLTSDKTSNDNVYDALEDLYNQSLNNNICPEGWICNLPKCVRATTLHTTTCNNNSGGCRYTIGYRNIITYGNLGTPGILASGDAFTCDVNGDGDYSEETERFYYVSDLYTETIDETDIFDTNYAVLIYYSNTIIDEDNVTQNNTTGVAYHSSDNYHGPVTTLAHIPNKVEGQWKNVRIKYQTRQIYEQFGGTIVSGGTLPQYTYTNKAARLLTVQEIKKACNITEVGSNNGELDTCSYLMENTYYENTSNKEGYWLETPYFPTPDLAWFSSAYLRNVFKNDVNSASRAGVRPAIEVLKSDILY